MNEKTWKDFSAKRDEFRRIVQGLADDLPKLAAWQKKLVEDRGGPAYRIETPVVYNTALDEVGPDDKIKLILVADNPGRREQAAENRRYLVGPSGKLAAGFFRGHPEFGIDFYKDVLILNKTPVHTPRTVELAQLCKTGGAKMENALHSSQLEMAALLFSFCRILAPVPVWIIGYSEMKKGGLFETYTNCLRDECGRFPKLREKLFFFRHFSMNQFTVDLNKQRRPGELCGEALERMGSAYRERILMSGDK